jgi:WD40 repeat protein
MTTKPRLILISLALLACGRSTTLRNTPDDSEVDSRAPSVDLGRADALAAEADAPSTDVEGGLDASVDSRAPSVDLGRADALAAEVDAPSADVERGLDASVDRETPPCHDLTLTWKMNLALAKIDSVAFSPDGQSLAATMRFGRIFRISDGTVTDLADPCSGGGTSQVSYFPDGSALAAASCGATFTVFGTDGKFKTRLNDVGGGGPWVISPESTTVAAAQTQGIRLLQIATDSVLLSIPSSGGKTALAFSPDGATLLAAGADAIVRLWNARTGAALATLTARGPVLWGGLAVSPDGKLVAALSTGALDLWSLADGTPAGTMTVDPLATAFAFTPDSASVVAGGASVGVYDVATLRRSYEIGGRTYSLAISPDGSRVAAAGDSLQSLELYCLRRS